MQFPGRSVLDVQPLRDALDQVREPQNGPFLDDKLSADFVQNITALGEILPIGDHIKLCQVRIMHDRRWRLTGRLSYSLPIERVRASPRYQIAIVAAGGDAYPLIAGSE
jgi:hypothetical protein